MSNANMSIQIIACAVWPAHKAFRDEIPTSASGLVVAAAVRRPVDGVGTRWRSSCPHWPPAAC